MTYQERQRYTHVPLDAKAEAREWVLGLRRIPTTEEAEAYIIAHPAWDNPDMLKKFASNRLPFMHFSSAVPKARTIQTPVSNPVSNPTPIRKRGRPRSKGRTTDDLEPRPERASELKPKVPTGTTSPVPAVSHISAPPLPVATPAATEASIQPDPGPPTPITTASRSTAFNQRPSPADVGVAEGPLSEAPNVSVQAPSPMTIHYPHAPSTPTVSEPAPCLVGAMAESMIPQVRTWPSPCSEAELASSTSSIGITAVVTPPRIIVPVRKESEPNPDSEADLDPDVRDIKRLKREIDRMVEQDEKARDELVVKRKTLDNQLAQLVELQKDNDEREKRIQQLVQKADELQREADATKRKEQLAAERTAQLARFEEEKKKHAQRMADYQQNNKLLTQASEQLSATLSKSHEIRTKEANAIARLAQFQKGQPSSFAALWLK